MTRALSSDTYYHNNVSEDSDFATERPDTKKMKEYWNRNLFYLIFVPLQ